MGARSRTGKNSKAAAKTKTKTKAETKKETAETEQKRNLWQKTVNPDADLAPEEALMAAHWIRQATGIILGIVFGFLQMKGFPAFLTFIVVSGVGPTALISMFRELDLEEISKVNSIQTEGFMPAMALFTLSWILSYTVFLPPSS